jgi:sugar-specific transcriptional regulator TrmB
MPSKLEAVESVMELGLTEYEARCFVALAQLSEGTAREISRIADVPQSRVYDIADDLHRMGVVDVQESDPRTYRVASVDRALERLERDYEDALETAADHLSALESRSMAPRGVWGVADGGSVGDRFLTHLADADEEVFLVVGEERLLDEAVLDGLREALTRDVEVYVGTPTDAVAAAVREAVPGAQVSTTDLPVRSTRIGGHEPGRLAVVDDETVVLSSLHEGLVPGECEESGLWATGSGQGLLVWLRPFLDRRRECSTFATN